MIFVDFLSIFGPNFVHFWGVGFSLIFGGPKTREIATHHPPYFWSNLHIFGQFLSIFWSFLSIFRDPTFSRIHLRLGGSVLTLFWGHSMSPFSCFWGPKSMFFAPSLALTLVRGFLTIFHWELNVKSIKFCPFFDTIFVHEFCTFFHTFFGRFLGSKFHFFPTRLLFHMSSSCFWPPSDFSAKSAFFSVHRAARLWPPFCF